MVDVFLLKDSFDGRGVVILVFGGFDGLIVVPLVGGETNTYGPGFDDGLADLQAENDQYLCLCFMLLFLSWQLEFLST